MKDNTVKSNNGIELYIHDIYYFADQYAEEELEGDRDSVKDSFVGMILYIADRIPRPGTENIDLLDSIFDIYFRLCSKYRVLPTLEVFSFLVGIDRSTFSTWISGEYRSGSKHSHTAKKWFDICKSCTINRLHNKGGTDANLIFIAKAAYGMAETAPVQTAGPQRQQLSTDEIIMLDDREGRESDKD